MPFPATKALLIARTKRVEICDTLHEVQNAITEDEMIKFGLPLAVYAYRSGIVDDALLGAEFTEAILNTNGVYTVGVFILTDTNNNIDDFYIMKTADVTLTLTGNAKCKVQVMGAANLTLITNDTSYCTVKAYGNATLHITINDDSMVELETCENTISEITQNDNSILQVNSHDSSVVTQVGNANSFGNAKIEQRALLTYTLNGAAQMSVISYNQSQVILT